MTMCFDATNLKALNFYLPQMGLSVEDKLKKYLDQRFEERIPENIRQFIQYQTGTAQNDQRITDQNQSVNPEPSSRRLHRERSLEITESASEQTMA
ncbi:MAG: hypothetical protein DBY04_01155 [Clostridiales bacterium]|nr:MAG: hypothetical protein DBY04_01155 [Clostridiales bacterium]